MPAAVANVLIIVGESMYYSIYARLRNAKMASKTVKRLYTEKLPTAD